MAVAADADPVARVASAAPDPVGTDPAASVGIICLPPDRPDPQDPIMAAAGTGLTATAAAAAACCR